MPEPDESWFIPDAVAEAPLRKFAPDEMVACEACLRANAPTRAQCMYCGAPLNQSAGATEVETATAERVGEPNFYIVAWAREGQTDDDSSLNQIATRFQLKPEELRVALSTGTPLPLSSTASQEEATRIISELSTALATTVVPAINLKTDCIPVGIRALEFAGDNVTAISKIGRQRLPGHLSDLQLTVTGRLLVHRVEVDERRSRGSVKSLDRRELSEDQSVIDIYQRSADAPWRIIVNDFDFSCLGDRKSLTAFDNARALIDLLKDRTPTKVNESYARVRPMLNNVWPLENAATESRSRRPRAKRQDFSTVTASSNEAQFNKYSRLLWCIQSLHQQSGETAPAQDARQ